MYSWDLPQVHPFPSPFSWSWDASAHDSFVDETWHIRKSFSYLIHYIFIAVSLYITGFNYM